MDHGRWFWGNLLNHLCPWEGVGGIVEGEVWQSSGSVAGCCSLDGCDLLVYVCLNSWASSCMGCKKVLLSRLICPMFC